MHVRRAGRLHLLVACEVGLVELWRAEQHRAVEKSSRHAALHTSTQCLYEPSSEKLEQKVRAKVTPNAAGVEVTTAAVTKYMEAVPSAHAMMYAFRWDPQIGKLSEIQPKAGLRKVGRKINA